AAANRWNAAGQRQAQLRAPKRMRRAQARKGTSSQTPFRTFQLRFAPPLRNGGARTSDRVIERVTLEAWNSVPPLPEGNPFPYQHRLAEPRALRALRAAPAVFSQVGCCGRFDSRDRNRRSSSELLPAAQSAGFNAGRGADGGGRSLAEEASVG